jgi:hypothetical protein
MIFAIAAVKSPASRTGGKASGTTQAVQTQPQCHSVAAESEFDGLTGQGVGFALERRLHGIRRTDLRPQRTPGRVARQPLHKRAAPLFLLFIHEIISRY